MENVTQIVINQQNGEELLTYSEILGKSPNVIINEALELYFETQRKKMMEKNLDDENMFTILDYDEFWDGVDLE